METQELTTLQLPIAESGDGYVLEVSREGGRVFADFKNKVRGSVGTIVKRSELAWHDLEVRASEEFGAFVAGFSEEHRALILSTLAKTMAELHGAAS